VDLLLGLRSVVGEEMVSATEYPRSDIDFSWILIQNGGFLEEQRSFGLIHALERPDDPISSGDDKKLAAGESDRVIRME
jgi:hypothetical protein